MRARRIVSKPTASKPTATTQALAHGTVPGSHARLGCFACKLTTRCSLPSRLLIQPVDLEAMRIAVQSLETDLGVRVENFSEISLGAVRPVGEEAKRLLRKTAPETASSYELVPRAQLEEIHDRLHGIDGAEACRDVAVFGVRDGRIPPRPQRLTVTSGDGQNRVVTISANSPMASFPPVVSPSGHRPDLVEQAAAALLPSTAQRLGESLEASLAATDQRMANAARAQAAAMASAPPPHPTLVALEELRVTRAIEEEALALETPAVQAESGGAGHLERLRMWWSGD